MKKVLIVILSVLLISAGAYAALDNFFGAGGMSKLGGVDVVAGGCSATYSETFTTANTNDVDGNTMFDAEADSGSRINVLDNKLTILFDQATTYYLAERTLSDVSEVTVKFTMSFSDVTGVDNGSSINKFVFVEANGGQNTFEIIFTPSGGDLATAKLTLDLNAGDTTTSNIDMSGLLADTDYDVVIYYVKASSTGGASLKIGSEAAVDTGFDDDNDELEGVGDIQIGGNEHYWGDGSDDTTITVDNFEVYLCDAR